MGGERILIIDDEPGVRGALTGILRDEGFAVDAAASGEEGLAALDRAEYEVVLLDVWLPGIDGLETLSRLRDTVDDSEVVMISGHATIETAVRATKMGAFDFIEKPLSLEKTLLVVRNALRQRRLRRRNRQLLAQVSRETEIIGDSPAARRLRREIELAAVSEAPLLIRGEQGSGREIVARRVHASGARGAAAFVEIPCGAVNAVVAEAMLFGGGRETNRVALARGGTAFLQDVGTLPEELQTRLAAVLQTEQGPAADVRWIASTAIGQSEPVAELAGQLDVMRIDVPALRDRRDDVPRLAERALHDLAREYGRPPQQVTAACMARLKAYAWPGNVRQLHNVIERILVLVTSDPIDVDHLPDDLGGVRAPFEDLYREFDTLDDGIAAFERYYIARMLDETGRDRRLAAERLGLQPDELQRRLERPGD